MKISEFLSPADVLIDLQFSDKRQVLQELARRAANSLDLPADTITDEIVKREELGSTGTGGGIAIPHARIQSLTKPFGLIARDRFRGHRCPAGGPNLSTSAADGCKGRSIWRARICRPQVENARGSR